MKIAVILLLSLTLPLPFMGLLQDSYSYGLESTNNSVNKQTIVVTGPMPEIFRDEIVLRLDPIYPVDDETTVSSDFGYRLLSNCKKCSRYHQGIDYPASENNDKVYAIMDGVITRVEHKGGYGLHVYIDHVIYPDELVYSSIYAHLKSTSVTKSLSIGDKVVKGQHIGHIGQTGLATGPHLHFEIHKNGSYMNPDVFYARNSN